MADGATMDEANAQVAAIGQRLAGEYPDTNREWTVRVGATREALAGTNTWVVLALLFTVVGLLLVLACANIMNLLIARLLGRRQELAVRTALGATRGRVVRQIVAESLLIGLAGGLLGLVIAGAGLRGVHTVATEPFFRQLGFDIRVVAFAFGLAVIAPLAFAIVPTLRVLRHDVRSSLTDATSRSVGGAAAARGRSALVVLQVSLAVMLLVVAGLIVRSMNAVMRIDLGYDPTRLLSAEVEIPAWKEGDDLAALRLRQRLLTRVRQIPGVDGAALVTELPALRFPQNSPFDIAGRDSTSRDRPAAAVVVTTADYFAVVDVPLVAGRGFEAADAASSRAVTVLSAESARRYWGEAAKALGAVVRLPAGDGAAAVEATVIGVSRDTANPDVDQAPQPVMYLLDEHRPSRRMVILLRAQSPAALAPALRAAIRDVDPDLPPYQLRTAADGFEDENSSNRLLVGMFAAFAYRGRAAGDDWPVRGDVLRGEPTHAGNRRPHGAGGVGDRHCRRRGRPQRRPRGAGRRPRSGRRTGAIAGHDRGAVRGDGHRSGHLFGRGDPGPGRGARRGVDSDAQSGRDRSDSEPAGKPEAGPGSGARVPGKSGRVSRVGDHAYKATARRNSPGRRRDV